jgi:hypothetical protein
MKHYISHLHKEHERVQSERIQMIRDSERKRLRDCRIHCDTPLTDQVETLMRSLPPAQRNRYWSMEELTARLQGRYSARPCAGKVGQALRQLGWTKHRDWSQYGGGRRIWRLVK